MKEALVLLGVALGAVGPSSKYFLIRFIHLYGTPAVRKTVKELAQELGLSDRVVTTALKELVAAGWLVVDLVVQEKSGKGKGRGRPGSEYTVSPELLARLHGEADLRHFGILERVLTMTPSRKPAVDGLPAKADRTGLSIENRVLLMVLLVCADGCGVVRGKGSAEICALTGLNKNQLRLQLGKLKELKYLRSHVPGVAGHRLFARVPGAYFLNMRHPAYGRDVLPGVTLVFPRYLSKGDSGWKEAENIFRQVRQGKEAHIEIRDLPLWVVVTKTEVDRLLPLFSGWPVGMIEFFQMRLEEYASYWLSARWDDLASESWGIETGDAELCRLIKAELQLAKAQPLEEIGKSGEDVLVRLISDVSLQMARAVRRDLENSALIFRPESMDYALLPATDRGSCLHFSLECYPKVRPANGGQSPLCFLMEVVPKMSGWQYKAKEKWFIEDEFPIGDRYKYGLLTKPKEGDD